MIIISDTNTPTIAYEIPQYSNIDIAYSDIQLAIKYLLKERERQRIKSAKKYVPTGTRRGCPKGTPINIEPGEIIIQKIEDQNSEKVGKKPRNKKTVVKPSKE